MAGKAKQEKEKQPWLPLNECKLAPGELALSILSGACLGLSAPGNNLWFLAWIGLIPFLLFIASSKSKLKTFSFALLFGTSYNLVSLNWYLGLFPLDWLGFNQWQGWLLAGAALSIVSFHQGLLIAILAVILHLIPMQGSFVLKKSSGKWQLPALLIIPFFWVLFLNKIGNAPSALGVPWSMIEYSQYNQKQIIQCASIIGGIGIGALIVLVNTSLASLYATIKSKSKFKSISAKNKGEAIKNLLITLVFTGSIIALGIFDSNKIDLDADTDLFMLQGNINIEMQKTKRSYSLSELLEHYEKLLADCKDGLIIWTESSVPVFLSEHRELLEQLREKAKTRNLDMVVGAMHRKVKTRPYNAAYGIGSNGTIVSNVYHKRYLVPFGEYAPAIIDLFPPAVRKLTNTPAGGGFAAGTVAHVLDLTRGKVAPLICFECISPELVAESTRAGGQLLVNVSDLAWFHESIIGEQMIAFATFRAIENRRYMAFAANTGPSVVITPKGDVTSRSKLSEPALVQGKVKFLSEQTIFTRWFR